ncbi:MAG: hypothetical protein II786_03785 [Muribaculaceae bacterium]|nr:hypothetical protein [Muribaculaceae bacterium]
MKKNLLYLAALLCCLFTLSACGDDDPKENAVASAVYTIDFGVNIHDAASIIIYYKGENNETKFEALHPGTFRWTKTVTSKKFPAEFGYKLVISPNSESELTFDNYNISIVGTIAGSVSTGGSFDNTYKFIKENNTPKNNVVSTLKEQNGASFGYKLNKNGDASRANLNYDL